MSDPLPLNSPKLDSRLQGILGLLESDRPSANVAAAVDQFVTDYGPNGHNESDLLFYENCRESWKQDGRFCWGMIDIACGLSNKRAGKTSGIQRGDEWDRLLSVCEEMLRFLLDSRCSEDWAKHSGLLKNALRRYLSLKGHVLGTVPPPAKTEQGEGRGGRDSTPEQQAVTSGADRAAILAKLQPADRKAYFSCKYAETKNGKRLQDYEAHAWLNEYEIDTDKGDVGELADYQLPAFVTWSKQVRNARKPLGEQKYTRRTGRPTGRSVVSEREIEYQKGNDK